MIRCALALAVLSAGAVLPSSGAAVPPPVLVRIAVAHGRPVAGNTFTGFAITPAAGRIVTVSCDATIGRKTLHGRQQRFYVDGVAGPAAVSCGWKIPSSAHGMLSARATVSAIDGTEPRTIGPTPVTSWRVKH